jgi:type II secretory pathway component GspD/PulD (secretin)
MSRRPIKELFVISFVVLLAGVIGLAQGAEPSTEPVKEEATTGDPVDDLLKRVKAAEEEDKARKEKGSNGQPREMTPQEVARMRSRLRVVTDRLYRDARRFFLQDEWDRCILTCNKILKRDPGNLLAQKLKYKAENAKIEHRLKMLAHASKTKDKEAIADLDEASTFPGKKPELLRPVGPNVLVPLPLRAKKKPKSEKMLAIEQKLNQRVDLNMMDVDLAFLLSTLHRISGINIIADEESLADKKLKILVEDMPLKEILKFITRKYDDIAYTVTEEAIWVTKKGSVHPGMEVRIHPLNIGLTISTPMKTTARRGTTSRGGRTSGAVVRPPAAAPGAAGANQKSVTYLEDVIDWMRLWPDWPTGTELHIDNMTSSLMVYTTPEMHDKISDMLAMMDRPPIQVLISTRFITIDVDDLADLGLDFNMNTKPGQDVGMSVNTSHLRDGDLGSTFTGIITGQNTDPLFTATLRAMQQKGRSKILSAPQILTLNNQKGIIDLTTQFNYVTDWREVTTTDVTDQGNQIERVTNYVPVMGQKDIGFKLEVTPSVGRDLKHIILELRPEITDVEGNVADFDNVQVLQLKDDQPVPATRQPIINNQSLSTRLVICDGDMVVIGGLMKQKTSKTITKVPILGSIPLIGVLFRRETDTVSKSHLVIVVKAKIIDPSGRGYKDRLGVDEGTVTGVRQQPVKGPWRGYNEPGVQ